MRRVRDLARVGPVLLALCLLASCAWAQPAAPTNLGVSGSDVMAVTVESATLATAVASASSITFPHTCTAAVGLFVGVGNQSPQAVTGITYNGVAMTMLWDKVDDLGIQRSAGALMVNPAAGTHDVVVTFAAAVDIGVAGAVGLLSLETSSVANAHRTVYTANETAGGAPSVTVADSQNGDLVIDSAVTFSITIAAGAGQTSRAEDDAIAGGGSSWGLSTESATGANTVMSWTGGSFWATGATALIAASAGASVTYPQLERVARGIERGILTGDIR